MRQNPWTWDLNATSNKCFKDLSNLPDIVLNLSGKNWIYLQEEREERQLRKAEMEMTKAENMIEHETEIYSKPARTWFQTKKEKALAAKKEEIGDQKQSNKRERDDKRNAEKQKRGESKDDPRKKPKLMQVISYILRFLFHCKICPLCSCTKALVIPFFISQFLTNYLFSQLSNFIGSYQMSLEKIGNKLFKEVNGN